MGMIIYATSKTKKIPGPDLVMNCDVCGESGVEATSIEVEEKISIYFIPLPLQRERHIICNGCGSIRVTDLQFDELAELGPDEIEPHLHHRISIIAQFFALASILLFYFPLVGAILGIVGIVQSGKSRGWTYKLSWAGIVLNIVLWGGLLLRSALVELMKK